MIPECVNCKNLFTCKIKDKPKNEACVEETLIIRQIELSIVLES